MKYSIKAGTKAFHVERNYNWKNHRPVWEIWRYDPNACAIYKAMTWPFVDCPQFDSFIQAVRYLKENIGDLV